MKTPRHSDSISTSSSTLVNIMDEEEARESDASSSGSSFLSGSEDGQDTEVIAPSIATIGNHRSDNEAEGDDDSIIGSSQARSQAAAESSYTQTTLGPPAPEEARQRSDASSSSLPARSNRLVARRSPFSSPKKQRKTFNTSSSRSVENNGRSTRDSLPRELKPYWTDEERPPCPDDCRCSDKEIALGRCNCAGSSGSTGTSSSDEIHRSEAQGREDRSLYSEPQTEGDYTAIRSRNSLTPRQSDSHRNISTLFSVSRSRLTAGQARSSLDDDQRSASSEEEDGLATSHSYSRISLAGRPSLAMALDRTRRRLSEATTSNGNAATPVRTPGEMEEQRRRKREERDRLIRQRIEAKRNAERQQDAGTSDVRDRQEGSSSPKTTLRGLQQDLQRLHRISRPPSATSIAAFAAQLSPKKRDGLRRSDDHDQVSSQLEEEPRSSSPTDHAQRRAAGRRASSDNEQDTRSLLDKGASKTAATSSSDPANAFGFAPRVMSIATSPSAASTSSASGPDSPRRIAHRRTGEKDVVSANATLPPSSPLEAGKRLVHALQPLGDGEARESEMLSDTVAVINKTRQPASRRVSEAGASFNSTRKSVRFSAHEEVFTHETPTPEQEAVEDADDSEFSEAESSESAESFESGPASELTRQETLQPTEEESGNQGTSTAKSVQSFGPLGTPIRLPPGAFAAATPLIRGLKQDETSSPSFSRHILKSVTNRVLQAVAPESPIMPGGLKMRQQNGSATSSNSLTPTKAAPGDRGLPPSYAAVANATTAHSRSDSQDSLDEDNTLEELSESRSQNLTDTLPRQSTPPPIDSTAESNHSSQSGRRTSLTTTSFEEDLRRISSPPPSSPVVKPELQPAAEEALPQGDADDSMLVTLGKVVSALQRKQNEITKVLLPPKQRPAESEADAAVELTRAQASALKAEEAASKRALHSNKVVDAERVGHIKKVGGLLEEQLDGLSLSDGKLSQRSSRPVWRTALAWLMIQVLLLYLALVIMRRGADHLFQTVHYDPFYSHLYDEVLEDLWLGPSMGAISTQATFWSRLHRFASAISPSSTSVPSLSQPLDFHNWTSVLDHCRTLPSRGVELLLSKSTPMKEGIPVKIPI